ncbi:hypothetical protein OBBRIDRAFT_831399 [Obba rivulosa]|uniref:Uncharacterized protein n=1 Tax=Obba rivulosa TaxID=1052685 RepID=A0A8E2DSH2_9APHY|nr:hypothetical protein OBBRIDRAFT_831399 [Obba rivulosa]
MFSLRGLATADLSLHSQTITASQLEHMRRPVPREIEQEEAAPRINVYAPHEGYPKLKAKLANLIGGETKPDNSRTIPSAPVQASAWQSNSVIAIPKDWVFLKGAAHPGSVRAVEVRDGVAHTIRIVLGSLLLSEYDLCT